MSPPQESLQNRLRNSFSSAYLTLASVIQGVVLAYLAANVGQAFHKYSLIQWILVGATLGLLAVIWHEYMMGAMSFVRVPDVSDSFVPFLVGGAELAVVQTIDAGLPTWLLAFAVLAALGGLNFSHRRLWISKDENHQYDGQKRHGFKRWSGEIVCGFAVISCLGSWYIVTHLSTNGPLYLVVACMPLVLTGIFTIHSEWFWRTVSKDSKSALETPILPSDDPKRL